MLGYGRDTVPLLDSLLPCGGESARVFALLVNLTAFPLSNGLLPYVAREVYLVDEKGLGYLAASYASGALIGSILFSRYALGAPLARVMLASSADRASVSSVDTARARSVRQTLRPSTTPEMWNV